MALAMAARRMRTQNLTSAHYALEAPQALHSHGAVNSLFRADQPRSMAYAASSKRMANIRRIRQSLALTSEAALIREEGDELAVGVLERHGATLNGETQNERHAESRQRSVHRCNSEKRIAGLLWRPDDRRSGRYIETNINVNRPVATERSI